MKTFAFTTAASIALLSLGLSLAGCQSQSPADKMGDSTAPKMSDGKMADGMMSDGKMSDGKMSGEMMPDGKMADDKMAGEKMEKK